MSDYPATVYTQRQIGTRDATPNQPYSPSESPPNNNKNGLNRRTKFQMSGDQGLKRWLSPPKIIRRRSSEQVPSDVIKNPFPTPQPSDSDQEDDAHSPPFYPDRKPRGRTETIRVVRNSITASLSRRSSAQHHVDSEKTLYFDSLEEIRESSNTDPPPPKGPAPLPPVTPHVSSTNTLSNPGIASKRYKGKERISTKHPSSSVNVPLNQDIDVTQVKPPALRTPPQAAWSPPPLHPSSSIINRNHPPRWNENLGTDQQKITPAPDSKNFTGTSSYQITNPSKPHSPKPPPINVQRSPSHDIPRVNVPTSPKSPLERRVTSPQHKSPPLSVQNLEPDPEAPRIPTLARNSPFTVAFDPTVSTISPLSESSPEAAEKMVARQSSNRSARRPLVGPDASGYATDDSEIPIADAYNAKAIAFHEQERLVEALEYFHKAANLGSPTGLFMFGMSLRHGWGCDVNPERAFVILKKALRAVARELLDAKSLLSLPGVMPLLDGWEPSNAKTNTIFAQVEYGPSIARSSSQDTQSSPSHAVSRHLFRRRGDDPQATSTSDESNAQGTRTPNAFSADNLHLLSRPSPYTPARQRSMSRLIMGLNNRFDMSAVSTSGRPIEAAKRELMMIVYELGQSFRHGWGVHRNKVTAAFHFEIAASLGDPDAQIDIAFAYLQGEGVKKDKMRAAKYFRLAENQGSTIPGNSWIWKEKYDPTSIRRNGSEEEI